MQPTDCAVGMKRKIGALAFQRAGGRRHSSGVVPSKVTFKHDHEHDKSAALFPQSGTDSTFFISSLSPGHTAAQLQLPPVQKPTSGRCINASPTTWVSAGKDSVDCRCPHGTGRGGEGHQERSQGGPRAVGMAGMAQHRRRHQPSSLTPTPPRSDLQYQ